MRRSYVPKVFSIAYQLVIALVPFLLIFIGALLFDKACHDDVMKSFSRGAGEFLFIGIAASVGGGVDLIEAYFVHKYYPQILDGVVLFLFLMILCSTGGLIASFAFIQAFLDSGRTLAESFWHIFVPVVVTAVALSCAIQIVLVRNYRKAGL